jgi:hypothetical protein
MSSPSLRVVFPGEDPSKQEGYDAGDEAELAMEVSDSEDSGSESYSSEDDDSCIGATGIQGEDKITRAAAKALAKTYLPQLQAMILELGDTSGAALITKGQPGRRPTQLHFAPSQPIRRSDAVIDVESPCASFAHHARMLRWATSTPRHLDPLDWTTLRR